VARIKRTIDYLEKLKNKGYRRYDELLSLYNKWKKDLDIKALSDFLDIVWKEKDNIKPTYLGENEYNNFRGISFEEFCYDLLDRVIKESEVEDVVELFWNEKILTEEFYKFEDGKFRKHLKYKKVDLIIGKREGNVIHSFIIISCKIWQNTNWLDEDRTVLNDIRNRYPEVLGYSLCMGLNVQRVSLISSQKVGLKVFNLAEEGKLDEFIEEIKEFLKEVKRSVR